MLSVIGAVGQAERESMLERLTEKHKKSSGKSQWRLPPIVADYSAPPGDRCEKIFREQVSSVAQREQLEAAFDFVREGDQIVVSRLDRLARSVGATK